MKEDIDYHFSTGGVTRMVFPLIERMLSRGLIENVHWVSLNPSGPEKIKLDGLTLHHISLQKERLLGYGNVKETIWGAIHGTQSVSGSNSTVEDVFWTDDFSEYVYYNRVSAELVRNLDKEYDFDLFYVHDFQQLAVGQMLETLKPKVFRWHIPFDDSMIPDLWKEKLSSYFNHYDMIIVSCRKYLDSLELFGYTGKTRKLYPFVDPKEFSKPSTVEIHRVCSKLGIRDNDDIVLIVARMDPMKGQDRAIVASQSVFRRYPRLKLVLVGNGSFSGSKQGLALSKSDVWRGQLGRLSKHLGIENRIVFAGHLVQRELDSMYERCKFTVLPSVKEGFGLVAIESWIHRKACLVTERAGVTELIHEGKNGLLIDPDNTKEFSEKMSMLLDDSELTQRLAWGGNQTSKVCTIDRGLKSEVQIIKELVG